MEYWQKDFIIKHRQHLLDKTNVSVMFVTKLVASGILSPVDMGNLEKCSDDAVKKDFLFKLLPSRQRGFEALITALYETKQYPPLQLLVQSYITSSSKTHQIDKWDEIWESITSKIIHKPVNFHGQTIQLQTLFPQMTQTLLETFVKNEMTTPKPDDKPEDPVVIESNVPPPLEYYIPRTLTKRRYVDISLLQSTCSDIFLFRNIEFDDLNELANGHPVRTSNNQINQTESLTARFILLDDELHYEKICELTWSSVHLLEKGDNGYFDWVKSHGSLSSFRKLFTDFVEEISEKDFVRKFSSTSESDVICISDSPGTGKTTLLCQMAREAMHLHSKGLVVYMKWCDVIGEKGRNVNIDENWVQNAVGAAASKDPMGQQVVRQMLSTDDIPCELFLDGFDNLPGELRQVAVNILKILKTFKNVRVYVSSRRHVAVELEETMGMFGYSVKPFRVQDQVDLLVKYWNSETAEEPKDGEDDTKMDPFPNLLLQSYANILETATLFSVPHHCSVLAQKYLEIDQKRDENQPETVTGQVAFELIKSLVDIQIDSFVTLSNPGFLRRLKSSLYKRDFKTELIEAHHNAALCYLYPEHVILKPINLNVTPEELCSVGILETGDNHSIQYDKLSFTQRPFADYFVALMVVETISKPYSRFNLLRKSAVFDRFMEFTIGHVLFTENIICSSTPPNSDTWSPPNPPKFKNSVQCQFINVILSQQLIPGFDHITRFLQQPSNSIIDTMHQIILASVGHNYLHLFKLLGSSTPPKFWGTFPWSELLLIGANHASLELLEEIISLITLQKVDISILEFPILTPFAILTPLHVAVRRGDWIIFECLVDFYSKQPMFDFKAFLYLFHACVTNSKSNSDGVILQKVLILQYLVSKNKGGLEETKSDGVNPFQCTNIHPDLFQCLVDQKKICSRF